MIDAAALAREDAETVPLGHILGDVRAAPAGVLSDDRRQVVAEPLVAQPPKYRNFVGLERRRDLVGRLGGGYTEVEVKVALVAGRPVETPAHPLAEGE